MKIELRYFASLRESLECDEEVVDVPDSVANVNQLREWLAARGQPWSEVLAANRNVRAAVDQTMARGDVALHEGAEVAFFPPVTGG